MSIWNPIMLETPMAHCGICNSSYPATYFHRCCGQGECPSCVALKAKVERLERVVEAARALAAKTAGYRRDEIDPEFLGLIESLRAALAAMNEKETTCKEGES